MAEQGRSALMIKETIEKDYSFFAILIPDDIVYLKRGGRITPAAATLANLLKITPLLQVTDGEIDKFGTVRTYKKAIHNALDYFKTIPNKENYTWFVLDGDCSVDVLQDTKHRLMEIVPDHECSLDFLSPIVMSHTGPGSIAIGYTKKLK